MLQPKQTPYRRYFRVKYDGIATKMTTVDFGIYGLQAKTGGWITSKQIESVRVILSRATKKDGKFWIRIFPHLPKTKKPLEVRMGSGKGSPEFFVAVVKKNTVMFEITGSDLPKLIKVLKSASHKLPIICQVINKKGEIV